MCQNDYLIMCQNDYLIMCQNDYLIMYINYNCQFFSPIIIIS